MVARCGELVALHPEITAHMTMAVVGEGKLCILAHLPVTRYVFWYVPRACNANSATPFKKEKKYFCSFLFLIVVRMQISSGGCPKY